MPGSGKQSADVQRQIIEFLEAGMDPTTIHRRLKVGRSSIYRMKRSLQQHGTAYAPPETNKKNGRPKVLTAEQEQEIKAWLQEGKNRESFLDDMVWCIHDRFGMVCSTTTCSKIKRKWLRVIEAEERGEHLDPTEAQEQVRLEACRVARKPPARRQGSSAGSTPQAHMHTSAGTELAMQQRQQEQQQLLPQYTAHLDQSLDRLGTSADQQAQEQLQTEIAHAALHQGSL